MVAASFLSLLFYTFSKKYIYVLFIFYFFGIFSLNYYYYGEIQKKYAEVRITKIYTTYSIGESAGRKCKIIGFSGELNHKYFMEGEIKREIDVSKGIVFTLKPVKVLEGERDIYYSIQDLRNTLYNNFKKQLGKEKSSMIMGICFGDVSHIENKDMVSLNRLGIIHIISVSGFHIALIYLVLEAISGSFAALLLCFIFVMFTGASPPSLRAYITIFILKSSKIVYKNYNAISALSLACLLSIWFKPYLVTDIGFALTYLSTLSILLYYKKVQKLLFLLPKFLRDPLAMSTSAQILSIPYVFQRLYSFSLGFILSNILLVPLYSLIVILGNVSLIVKEFTGLFSFLCRIINMVFKIIDVLTKGILYITPRPIFVTAFDGLCIFFVFFSYMMFRGGYKQYKHLPMVILLLFTLNKYSLFPRVYIINTYEAQWYYLNYRGSNVVILPSEKFGGEEIKNIDTGLYPDKILGLQQDATIEISGLKVHRNLDESVDFDMNGTRYIFGNTLYEDSKNCDIIMVNAKKSNIEGVNYFLLGEAPRYLILGPKVITEN